MLLTGRTVQVLEDGMWVPIQSLDLKPKTIFRLFDEIGNQVEGGRLYVTLGLREFSNGVATIQAVPVGWETFEIMQKEICQHIYERCVGVGSGPDSCAKLVAWLLNYKEQKEANEKELIKLREAVVQLKQKIGRKQQKLKKIK